MVYVPNAFTPDNDGINESFLPIVSGVSIKDYSLKTFDRWGEIVFESEEINIPWIGNVKGSKHFAMNGVYVWQLDVKGEYSYEQARYVGSITLIR